MTRTLHQTLAGAALAASSALVAPPAHAINFQMTVSGTANMVEVIDPAVPLLRFATQAEGSGSFGLTGYVSSDIVNMATGQGSGSNRFIAANGDHLLGTFTVQLLPGDGPGALKLQGLTTFTGGTGAFAGAKGTASLLGSGQFISDTQALVTFEHAGHLAPVPEPASTALLLGGLAAIGAKARRRALRSDRGA